MKEHIADYLICPSTGSDLKLEIEEYDEERNEVKTGRLVTSEGRSYPIVNYIPRFVATDDYAENFSLQWNKHKTTQYATAENSFSEEQFERISDLTPEKVEGKLVLDAGCGSGRFVDILEKWGAHVVGIDLSYAIDAAEYVLGCRKNVHLIQASVFELPFKKNTFDYIWSYGVLMATPDTKRAFDSVAAKLKNDGELAIWIYSNYNRLPSFCSDLLRRVTTRIPKRVLYLLSYLSVPLYYIYKIPLIGHLLRNTLVISMRDNWKWRVLETFDWYGPTYQWKHRYPEVFQWYRSNGLEVIHLSEPPIGIVGRKQADG
ncbi:class I SAM-dependent methyltransferase [Candidatus Pacearchaeota archaeon]|nr:class I SAM-dependent methyltransferase [Candidatus Pacearchaeota archaeon]